TSDRPLGIVVYADDSSRLDSHKHLIGRRINGECRSAPAGPHRAEWLETCGIDHGDVAAPPVGRVDMSGMGAVGDLIRAATDVDATEAAIEQHIDDVEHSLAGYKQPAVIGVISNARRRLDVAAFI